ncbi:hypothetical protein F4677DRAFT_348435 [Hypoxylon crocopeplum]|nr:hypothetical protein F4677DRAFT_348435 [Hypoxylon crocopeplum]
MNPPSPVPMESATGSGELSILNVPPCLLQGPSLLHELVATSSAEDLSAIDCHSSVGDGIRISYSRLHAMSYTLAARISETLGLATPRDVSKLVIPILVPQSPALYVGLLGILKAGAAFCPLNIDIPRDRLKFILRDIGARLVLVDSSLVSKIPEDDAYKILSIGQPLDIPACSSGRSVPHRIPKAGDLAYVMYTSGSTGTPKGVGISHFAATQSLLAHDRYIPPFTRFLQFAAPTFDVSVFEIFFPLFRGRTLVCCSRAEMLTDLPGILRDMRIDACELTPSVAGSLLKLRNNTPSLRLLLTIGEMLTEPIIQEFGGDESEESLLWGMYGPTEATIHCTLQPAFSKRSSTNNIGIPLDTVSAFVIDGDASEFQVLPLGHAGELAVGGNQLAEGYINRPEQTSAAFVDTRWGPVYRTGDRARMLPDGTIECLGRISGGQVKLNGQRIELGEVEHALLRTPGCHGACAAVISNMLVAFGAVEEGLDRAEIRGTILAQCRSWLPAFMIPADIEVMGQFPRLSSGKVDRKALIEHYKTTSSHDLDVGEPFEDDLERRLCEIAGSILRQRISPLTRLSSLGLDSLAAIEYASTIRAIGIGATPIDILDSLTVRELSHTLRDQHDTTCSSSSTQLFPDLHQLGQLDDILTSDSVIQSLLDDIVRVEVCSPLQEAMVAETLKDARLYVNQIELHFPNHLTTESIRSWFFDLAQRNENLRTGFAHLGRRLSQVIWNRLEEDQVQVLSHARPLECLDDVELFLQRPFRLEIIPSGPLAEHHTVMLTLHHSIYDGWSMDLLIEDLSLLARGQPPVDRAQFSQVSQHLSAVQGSEIMDSREFWAEKLRGVVPTPLPNFRTAAVPNPQITTVSREIKVKAVLVRDFALRASVGPQVIFQACLSWLWGAINGTDDTIIGSVSSGRTLPVAGIEKIMGPCMTTLPLRTAFNRYRTIVELLQGLHMFNRETLRHGSLPLAEIKRAAGIPLAQKLFDIIFVYQETLASRRRDDVIVREAWHKDSVEAKLLVEISPLDGHFSCQLTWHSDAFSEQQVDTLFQHIDCLINYFVQNGEEPLSSISQCFPVENLSHYNENPKCVQTLQGLSELVEKTASRFPTHNALCFASSISTSRIEADTITYQELNSRANRIARYLQQSGAPPGGLIALVMEKSPLLYCTILGILKAGCAYLPILPSTPLQRIQLILEQARPQICLVDESPPRQMVETPSCSTIDLTRVVLSDYSNSNLQLSRGSTNLAYVIYTSGTTGAPKGVSVTNFNVLSNLEVLSRIYPHSPLDRMLQVCSQAFDMSVFEIFFSWGNGMCLCSATNDTLFEDLERAVRTLRITHLGITVTVASLLEPCNVPDVKFLATAGEPMTDKVLDKWAEQLWQGYGPSETTNICTVRKVTRGDSSQYLGWSFENTSAFVFSPDTAELVPLGCVGELCFGGDQVAAGYLEMPELTATKFIQHREYGRIYRSGDVGRMLPDGSLIILGRLDSQVKLRGLRIELQDIQAITLRSGLAKTCTSVLIDSRGASSQQLALFYVPIDHESSRFNIMPIADSTRQAIVTIQQILRAALPDYMVPSFIISISALPLTSSGKVDHELLRRSINGISHDTLNLYSSMQDLDEESLGWTEMEVMISEAISETIGADRKVISRWASFATLGIDSISAMPLARRLQTVFQRRIPLSLILSNPSIGRLASVIAEESPPATTQLEERNNILPDSLMRAVRQRFPRQGDNVVENVLPCTPLQEAMLSSSPSSSSGSSYCNQMLFRLQVPSQTMEQHWNTMFKRHGILRTCFVSTEDAQHPMVQVVLKSHLPTWKTFKADNSSFQDYVNKHGSSLLPTIDSGEPPVSLAIILLENSTEYLSFVCHHAIYDGVSVRHLLVEVEALSRHEQLPAPLPFDTFLQESLPLPPGTDDFWAEHFRSFSPLRFDKLTFARDSDPATVSGRTSTHPFSFSVAQLRDTGVSLLPLCQAAWAITLSLTQDTNDVCFGNVVSGRSIALDRIDTLVAPCFNTIPIRMDLSRVKFLHEVMKGFQHVNTGMMPYQFTGLRRIQSQLQLSPLFDTVLILQPQAEPLDESIWSLEQDRGVMDVPLVCEITPLKDQDILRLQLHRDPSIFSHPTTLLILEIFQHVFDACLEYPSSHVLSTSKLPVQWRHQIAQLSTSRELPRTETGITSLATSSSNESWTKSEATVRSVLSRLVKIPEEQIRRNTSIYRYGLDSIGAVQFATLLRRESCAISAVDVIESPTCAGIASRLKARESEEAHFIYDFDSFQAAVSKDVKATSDLVKTYEAILPCSPTQQGMISQFLTSKGKHYFNYASWAIGTEINPQQVVQAWTHLSARHQILRTGFMPVNHHDTSYGMVVYPSADFSVPVSVRQPNSFNGSKWRAEAASKALEMLSIPPWQVVIVDGASSQSTMHLAIHHALYDAYSLRMLLNQLTEFVSGVVKEEASPIQPALSACLDPAHSQSASEIFWKSKAEDLVINKFPTMTPLHITNRVAFNASRTCGTSSESLHRSAADAGVTIRAALQAAWTRVLSAYLGEPSVTFGVVLDGRTTKEERDAIFPMITTLPVLACNSCSNAELLENMMQYNTSLRRHERTPLSKIQRCLGRPDSQLFDAIIAYQASHATEGSTPWEVLDEAASLEYTVALEVVETASNTLELNLMHDGDILPTEQAHMILQQLDVVLVDLLTFPQGFADQLTHHTPGLFSILPAVRPQLLSPEKLLHQLVEQAARRVPTATALEFVEELGSPIRRRHWTYRELDEMGNRVANMLSSRNTPPGSIVATCFNKCPEAYFAILGILKAGCAFLSLDPSAPVSRLDFILEDSSAACLLIESGLSDDLDLSTAVPTYIVREHDLAKFPTTYQAPSQISPSDICYCLYTSGTTGTPKGCLITHDNTVQAMLAFEWLFAGHWDARSRWLQFASFHFDVSVLEQYWSWFVGITVVAAPKDLILSDITTTISSLDITHIDLTPSLARLVHPDEVPSLCKGVFITGGEQLRQEILHVWGPKEVIYNAYGPTEATIGVTMFQRVPANGRSSNIGIQFPNVGTYILEPGTEVPVLRGGVGELCVSGRLVGQGYLNRKDLTEERFPVLERYGERVYRTGDLVRVLHDGSFDFLGRADDQVKLRGQRLEIGEINHAIRAGLSHQLADVVTFVTRHLGQDRDLLVSFLAPVASPSMPAELQICSDAYSLGISREALEACRNSLPGYMVPTYILCVPFIPLSANNKADIKRLKQLFTELPHDHLRNLTTGLAGPGRALSEKEQLIAQAISTVVHIEVTKILPSASIFELGIDSINVVRLAMILRSQGFSLASPSLILRHPQISRLAQALRQANPANFDRNAIQVKQSIRAHYHRHIGMACKTLQVDKADVEYIAPCTPLQEGMITRSKAPETQLSYFNQFWIDLDAQVPIDRLRGCLDEMFTECAILRTAFLATTDGHIQVAVKHKAIPWYEVEPKERIEEFLSERRGRWFFSNRDTLRYPVEIDHFEHRGKQVLLLRLFHGVYDGRSFDLLLRGVNANYHNQPPSYGPPFVEVLPHGPLLRHWQFKPFWEEIFKNHTFQPIPALSDELGTSDVSVTRVFRIDGLEARRIALGVTHQTVLQAAWLVTLRQRLGFVPTIGIVFSGRSLAFDGVDNVIGPMLNTLPFRVEISDRSTWASLVQEVQEYNASALECAHTPLRDIQKWCSKGQPLFDTLLTFDREDIFSAIEAQPFWSSIHSDATLDYPLALEIILLRDQSLKANVVARKDVGTDGAVTSLLDEFSQALESLASSGKDTPLPGGSVTVDKGAATLKDANEVVSPHSSSTENAGGTDFFQSCKAREVRQEVASLAGLRDEDILETTSLFELGFDSIDAIKLVARLKKIGLHVTVSELMRSPTIKNIVLSHDTTSSNGGDDSNEMTSLEDSATFLRNCLRHDGRDLGNVTAILPPTPLQDSMVADMLLSGFHRYFNHDVLEIAPDTDVNRLKSSWEEVYAHSPILRTTFAEVDNPNSKAAFCQIVRDQPLAFSSVVELSSLDDIATVVNRARDRAAAAYGSSHLFQLAFVTTPENRYLVISIAHALYDGWSLELLHRDVQAAYEGHYHARGEYEPYLSRLLFSSPPAGPIFWADYLNDARPTILEPITERLDEHETLIHRSELVSKLTPRGLKDLCRRYRVTPQVLAQGCWAPVLASMARSLDVTFGVVLSGRNSEEAQGLLFPTMNTVPLRIVLHGTVAEYFEYLQATMSEIIEFQHVPLREVQKVAKFKGEKLFNTLFLLQNVKEHQLESGSPILKSVHASSAVEYPVCIEMETTENSIVWRTAVDDRYVSIQDAKRIMGDVEAVLHHFAEDRANVLEFDGISEKVSICGLVPFELSSCVEDTETAPKDSITQEIDTASLESPVIDVLSELSGIEKHFIDPNHSIYHLGLDSISAIKASSMLRKRGLDISVRDMLKAASIREILIQPERYLTQLEVHPSNALSRLNSYFKKAQIGSLLKDSEVDEAEVETVLPALPMQVHMLSVWQNTKGLLFFPRFTYEISGNASRDVISKAWTMLVAQTPTLRTRFAATGSVEMPFIQIITKPKPIDSAEHSLLDLGQGKWAHGKTATPFASICFEESRQGGTLVHLHIHHALYDGISLPVMMGHLLELCDNHSTSSRSADQPRWYHFVSDHYSPEIRQHRKEFWSSYLRGIHPIRLGVLQEPNAGSQKIGQFAQLRHNVVESVSRLKMASSSNGTTLQALFFAAYSKVLATLRSPTESSEEDRDVVFGIYLANRTSFGGLEEAPFPTLSIVPLAVRTPSTRSIIDLAIDIQRNLFEIGSFENASVGLWEIYDWTGVEIESCVNFLSTPGNLSIAYTNRSVTMTEIPREPTSAPEGKDQFWDLAEPNDFGSQNKSRSAFMHTVDIEVKVHGDGMDIGVFHPSSFPESLANDLIESIVTTLEVVC